MRTGRGPGGRPRCRRRVTSEGALGPVAPVACVGTERQGGSTKQQSMGGAQLGPLIDCMHAVGRTCVAASWGVVACTACSANKRRQCVTPCGLAGMGKHGRRLSEITLPHAAVAGTPGRSHASESTHAKAAHDLCIICAPLAPHARGRVAVLIGLRRLSVPTAACQDVRAACQDVQWAASRPVASMQTRTRLARTAAPPQPHRRRPQPPWIGSKTPSTRQRDHSLHSKHSQCYGRPCLRGIKLRDKIGTFAHSTSALVHAAPTPTTSRSRLSAPRTREVAERPPIPAKTRSEQSSYC
jgi:hypothetical protein